MSLTCATIKSPPGANALTIQQCLTENQCAVCLKDGRVFLENVHKSECLGWTVMKITKCLYISLVGTPPGSSLRISVALTVNVPAGGISKTCHFAITNMRTNHVSNELFVVSPSMAEGSHNLSGEVVIPWFDEDNCMFLSVKIDEPWPNDKHWFEEFYNFKIPIENLQIDIIKI